MRSNALRANREREREREREGVREKERRRRGLVSFYFTRGI